MQILDICNNILVQHNIVPTIIWFPLKTPEKLIGPFLKIGHTQPCPFLKSDPKSFPKIVKKPLQSIMQRKPIFPEIFCD